MTTVRKGQAPPPLSEVRNVAQAVVNAVGDLRAGRLSRPDAELKRPRPK